LVPDRQAALTRWHLDGAEHDNNRLEAATVWGDSSLRADGSGQSTARFLTKAVAEPSSGTEEKARRVA
jgi:hypothetical protein